MLGSAGWWNIAHFFLISIFFGYLNRFKDMFTCSTERACDAIQRGFGQLFFYLMRHEI